MGEKCGHIVQSPRKVAVVQWEEEPKIRLKVFQKIGRNKENVLCTRNRGVRGDICLRESSHFIFNIWHNSSGRNYFLFFRQNGEKKKIQGFIESSLTNVTSGPVSPPSSQCNWRHNVTSMPYSCCYVTEAAVTHMSQCWVVLSDKRQTHTQIHTHVHLIMVWIQVWAPDVWLKLYRTQ